MQRKKSEDTSCWLEGPSLINLFVNTRFMSSKASLRLKCQRGPLARSYAPARTQACTRAGKASPPASFGKNLLGNLRAAAVAASPYTSGENVLGYCTRGSVGEILRSDLKKPLQESPLSNQG